MEYHALAKFIVEFMFRLSPERVHLGRPAGLLRPHVWYISATCALHDFYNLCDICYMARGRSGRVVIEVDPALKRDLYVALATEEATLKDWFIQQAQAYLRNGRGAKVDRNGG